VIESLISRAASKINSSGGDKIMSRLKEGVDVIKEKANAAVSSNKPFNNY
jgi:hypothetical protein